MSILKIGHLAKYILEQTGSISTMKLQKLCYYAQVWHLHFTGTRLVAEDFQAWANGPVSYELFDLHRGQYMVDQQSLAEYSSSKLSDIQKRIVNNVLEVYKGFSGAELSALSHSESPWRVARGNTSPGMISTQIISDQSMKDFAKTKVESN